MVSYGVFEIENVQIELVKMILGLAFTTYENALFTLKLKTSYERTSDLVHVLNFAKKILSLSKYSHMLPVNSSTHTMTLRNNSKTNRMFYSSIPYMKHLLNGRNLTLARK